MSTKKPFFSKINTMVNNDELSFVRVQKNQDHAKALYELLHRRVHSISHKKLPNWQDHVAFVFNHPYRAWFLIEFKKRYVGSIYVLKNNSIGVAATDGVDFCIPLAIEFILKKYKPLPAIKSVRAAEFDINVSPENKELISLLEAMGARRVQVTYAFGKL